MGLLWAITLYVFFLAVYWFLVLSVLWHLKEYTLPHDYSRWIVAGFLVIMVILNLMSLFLLLQLPL